MLARTRGAQLPHRRHARLAWHDAQVYSGLRFVRQAAEARIPVAIVNIGETRGDAMACLKLAGRSGDVMTRLQQRLLQQPVQI